MYIGIVGATGEVGRMMIKVLEERKIKIDKLSLFASKRSAGEVILFNNKPLIVQELTEKAMTEKYDYLLFSAGSSVSKKYASIATDHNNTIIDNSSAFRSVNEIPLVIPEINGNILKRYNGIIANPNCSTIQMLLALNNLHKKFIAERIVVSTYQAVSGAGHKAMKEMENQRKGRDNNQIFPKKIDLNVIPQIGEILENGYSSEEMKMQNETVKIFDDSQIKVLATTVRVPVVYGHSESIFCEFKKEIYLEDIKLILQNSESVVFHEDGIITPLDIVNSDESHIARLRFGFDNHSINFWNVANNLRVGAATNAIRIMEKHIELN